MEVEEFKVVLYFSMKTFFHEDFGSNMKEAFENPNL